MSFKTIKKESTLEVIVQQIKNQIKKGILKPGEKLPSERELASLLGVSRTSVREAIKALSFSGYLEVIQGKGTYILEIATQYDEIVNFFSEFSNYSLDYLMEARIMLEGEFARLAAANASQEEIDVIERVFNEICNSKDTNTFFVKDLQFHLTIAKATHNPIMNGLMKIIVEMLYKETQKIIKISEDTRENTIETTRDLVQAIKQRDAEKAKELMSEHIRNIRVSLE
ncbi:Pyruvate dehydrogenase complex repressor [subsurface metagenome]|jgi:GntR family transcriptional repressor for pyruvate dehydrogenase complex|nr:MAG: FadR family transcriptional regulator [Candidatus Atribacteria bacterium 1244-E10-H5-B2]